jgi:hypothetical protein
MASAVLHTQAKDGVRMELLFLAKNGPLVRTLLGQKRIAVCVASLLPMGLLNACKIVPTA